VNRKYLAQNVGRRLQLHPAAHHIDDAGNVSHPANDNWILDAYQGTLLKLRHEATGATGYLVDEYVSQYKENLKGPDQPGVLWLLAQCFEQNGIVSFQAVSRPGESLPVFPRVLLAEAYLQASLECHSWKNAFFARRGNDAHDDDGRQYTDVWDLLEGMWPTEYSAENYQRFHPLFLADMVGLRARLERLIQLFGHILPHGFQAELVRGVRQLEVERATYLHLPALIGAFPSTDADAMFRARFVGVNHVLRGLAQSADHLRDDVMAMGDQADRSRRL
jgi:hypothetical protein